MKAPRRTPVYIFRANIADVAYFSAYKGKAIPDGAEVNKCAGHGVGRAPRPYTYVKDAKTGEFLGMVHRGSLVLKVRKKGE